MPKGKCGKPLNKECEPQEVTPMHDEEDCRGHYCPFHNPSNHHMKTWQKHIRYDRGGLTERICKHGVGHPDPDSLTWLKSIGSKDDGVHGCDGCCKPEPKPARITKPFDFSLKAEPTCECKTEDMRLGTNLETGYKYCINCGKPIKSWNNEGDQITSLTFDSVENILHFAKDFDPKWIKRKTTYETDKDGKPKLEVSNCDLKCEHEWVEAMGLGYTLQLSRKGRKE